MLGWLFGSSDNEEGKSEDVTRWHVEASQGRSAKDCETRKARIATPKNILEVKERIN